MRMRRTKGQQQQQQQKQQREEEFIYNFNINRNAGNMKKQDISTIYIYRNIFSIKNIKYDRQQGEVLFFSGPDRLSGNRTERVSRKTNKNINLISAY